MSFNNSWDMPHSRGRHSSRRFQTHQATRRRGTHWQKSRGPPYSSYKHSEHNNYNLVQIQPVQESEYYPSTYPESSNRRFRSPPSFKSPIYEERPRPASPLPGSEEYTQRNIQQTSEYIKRQLNLEGQTEDSIGNEFQEPMQNEDFMPSQEEESVDMKNVERDSEQNIKKTNKLRNRNRSNESIDVGEIHDKIIKHISQLSYNKKMNLVYQGSSGYDTAIQQIQKQQRLELSKALRNMSNKTTQDSSDCEVINAIIPDIGIRIEDLPREVIAQLSSTLDIDFDVNMVNPEACFKQAEELLGDESEFREGKDLDPFDFEYLNTPMDNEPNKDKELKSDGSFDNDSRFGDEKEDEFVLEINPNSSYLSGNQGESVNSGPDGQTKSASVLKIKRDVRGESNEQPSPKYQKKQNIKLMKLEEQPTTSNSNNPFKKDNSKTTNLDLVLSQNLWLNNPKTPEEEMLKPPLSNHSPHPDVQSNYIPPLIPPNQLYDEKRDFSKNYPKYSPPNPPNFDDTKDYSKKQNFEEDFASFDDPRQLDLQQIEIQQQLHHLKMKQQQLEKKRRMCEPSSSKILLQQQFLLKENLELELSPRQNDFKNPEFSSSNDGYQMTKSNEGIDDGHKPTIAEQMYLDSNRKFQSNRQRNRDHQNNKFSYNRDRNDDRRNRNRRSLSNESFGDKRPKRCEEDFGRRNDRRRNPESWDRSRSREEREVNFNNNSKDKNEDMSSSVGHKDVKRNEESKYGDEKNKRFDQGHEKNKRFDQGHEKKRTPVREIEKKQSIIEENESKVSSSVDENKEKKGGLEESEENVTKVKQVIEQFDENGKRKPFRIPKLSQKKNDSTVGNKADERPKEPPKKIIDDVPKKELKKTNEPNKEKNIEEKMNKLLDNEINKGKDTKNPELKVSKKDSKKYKRIDRERLKSEENEDRKLKIRKSDEKNKLDQSKKCSEALEKKSKGKDKLSEEEKVGQKKKGKSKRLEEAREKKSVEKEIKVSKVREEIDVGENDTEKTDVDINEEETIEDVKEAGGDKLGEEDKSENVVPMTDGEKNEQCKEKVGDDEKPHVEEESNEDLDVKNDMLNESSEEMQETAEEDKMVKQDDQENMMITDEQDDIQENTDVETKECTEKAEGDEETGVKEKEMLMDEKEVPSENDESMSKEEKLEEISLDVPKFLNPPKIVKEEEVVSKKTWKSPGERKLLPPLVHPVDSEETIQKLSPRVLNFEPKDEQKNIFEQMEDFNALMMNQSDKKIVKEKVKKIEGDMKGEDNNGDEMIGNIDDAENDVNVKGDQSLVEIENKAMDEEKIDDDGRRDEGGHDAETEMGSRENLDLDETNDELEETLLLNVPSSKSGKESSRSNEDDTAFIVNAEKEIESRENVDMDEINDELEETFSVNVPSSKSGTKSSRSNEHDAEKEIGSKENVDTDETNDEMEETISLNVRRSKSGINRSRSNARPKSKQKVFLESKIKEFNKNLNAETEESSLTKKRKHSKFMKTLPGEASENEPELPNAPRRRSSLRSTQDEVLKPPVSIEIQTDPVYVVPLSQNQNTAKCNKTHCANVVNRLKHIDKVIADLLEIRQSLYEELRFEGEETLPKRKRNSSCEANADDTEHQKIAKKPNSKRRKAARVQQEECSKKSVDDSIKKTVDDSIKKSVDDSIKKSVDDSIKKSVDDSIKKSVNDSIKKSVDVSIKKSVDDSIKKSVDDSIKKSVDDSIKKSVDDSIKKSVDDSIKKSVGDSITSVIHQFSDPFEIPPKSESPFLHPAHIPQVNITNELRVNLIRYEIADLKRFKDELDAGKQESLVKLVSAVSEGQCGSTVSEDLGTNVNVDFKGWVGSILVIKVIENVVVAGNDKGSLYFYDLVDGDLKAQMHLAQKPITSVCVSSSKEEKTTLYVGSLDGTLHVVDFNTHESVKSLQVEDPIQCMESAWGYIFIGSHKGNLIRYDIKKEKLEDSISISNTNVLVLRATQEGARKVLLVATRNYPVSVRDAMTGLLMRTMEGTLNPTVYTLLFHNSHVYCGTRQHDVLVYTFQDGQLMFKHEQSNTSGVVCMTIVKNLLFVGCYNGNIYVYNTNTNDFITSLAGPGGLFLSMEVAGNIIVAGTKQNRFRAWTLPDAVLSQID